MNFFVVKSKDKYLCGNSRETKFKKLIDTNFTPKLYNKLQYAESAKRLYNNRNDIEIIVVDLQGII